MSRIIVTNIETDPDYSYEGYKIFISNGLYGIKNPSGVIIINPIFSKIQWLYKGRSSVLIEFNLNGLSALYRFNDLQQDGFLQDFVSRW